MPLPFYLLLAESYCLIHSSRITKVSQRFLLLFNLLVPPGGQTVKLQLQCFIMSLLQFPGLTPMATDSCTHTNMCMSDLTSLSDVDLSIFEFLFPAQREFCVSCISLSHISYPSAANRHTGKRSSLKFNLKLHCAHGYFSPISILLQ